MPAYRPLLKIVTTLWLAVSIGIAGGVPSRVCADQIRSGTRTNCQNSRSCCCGKAAPQRACTCHRDEVPVQPSSSPATGQRLPEWIAAPAALLAAAADLAPEPAELIGVDGFFSQRARSIQSLFCIWRI